MIPVASWTITPGGVVDDDPAAHGPGEITGRQDCHRPGVDGALLRLDVLHIDIFL